MTLSEFQAAFFQPPVECTQSPFWFLNGPVDGKIYAGQMDKMAAQGVRQAMPHPRFGMDRRDYLTEHYFDAFREMAENAREKGLKINLYDEFNWSSGNAGGRLTADPKNCALGIAMGCARAARHFTYSDWEKDFRGWGKMEAVLAVGFAPFRSETEIGEFQLTRSYTLENGVLQLDLPEGDWMAFVIYTLRTRHPSPLRQGNGGIVDYLNPQVTDQFLELTYEAYYDRLGEFFGSVIPSIFYDEVSPYASGNFSWTDRFPQYFQACKGYSILEKLPHLFFDCSDETPKVRMDYWDALTRCYAESFVGKLADWCGRHGIALTGHTHEDSCLWMTAGNIFRNLGPQQWVGMDSLLGRKPYHILKPAASAAHIAGKKPLVCEALGLLHGWSCSPKDLKKAYNQLAIAGVGLLVPHGFFQTVDNPKAECPPSFFDCNPYWRYYRTVSELTDRQCCVNRYLDSQADAAVFYPVASWWAGGRGGRGRAFPWSSAPENSRLTAPEYEQYDRILDTLMEGQLDYDCFDSDALADARGENGRLRLGPGSYRILILPAMSAIFRQDAQRLLSLAEQGVPIAATREFAPAASAEAGKKDPELAEILEKLYPKIHWADSVEALPALISRLIEPDVVLTCRNRLETAHRRMEGLDVYLLSCLEEGEYALSVRCTGAYGVLLNASGRQVPAFVSQEGTRTGLRFSAQADELYYFVISKEEFSWPVQDMPENPELFQELDSFSLLPCPQPEEPAADEVLLPVPTCKTREISFESPEGDRLSPIWENWMTPDFPTEDWQTLSLKRGGARYDHTGSRLFRFEIPAGANAIRRPLPIAGEYALYVNGNLLELETGFSHHDQPWLEFSGCENAPGVLAIECSSMAPQFGICAPPLFRISPVQTSCKDWRELGLGWYSGFCRYETEFETTEKSLWLDLGDVRECAEVILNGQNLGSRIWDPYLLDLKSALRPGTNRLQILCCNLISNEFSWDPLGTRGGGERLTSGILGPVRLLKDAKNNLMED